MTKEDKSYLNFDVPISKMEYSQDWIDRMAIWDELWTPGKRKFQKTTSDTYPDITKNKALSNILDSWRRLKFL